MDTNGECWLWDKPNSRGYGNFHAKGITGSAHRFSWYIANGHTLPPEGHDIDHTCRNKLCVRPDHLRAVTHRENMRNRGVQSGSSAGARGVSRHRASGKWRVTVGCDGKILSFGLYHCWAQAIRAARTARREVYGKEFIN
ncbi:MAG: HNH endonuclease signature motif containing protein [Brevibacterium sp.]